jgi:hypothetical protein
MAAITRTDFRNALFTVLSDQKTATPDKLRDVLRFRPGGMGGEKPKAWIGQIRDGIEFVGGTRTRVMRAEIVIAGTFPSDLVTNADPFDALLDSLAERFSLISTTTMVHNSVLEIGAIDDGEVAFLNIASDGQQTTTYYRGGTLSLALNIWEGRD